MFYSILSFIANSIIWIISTTGHIGVGILMAADSCNIPIPSEVTMPFAGFLAHSGVLSLWGVIVAGTVGSIVGSLASYYLANWIMQYRAKHIWLQRVFSDHGVKIAEKWFAKYGNLSVFVGRMVPVVRTFISLPAGIARMNVVSFTLFTTLGSFIWSSVFAYIGYMLGEQWQVIEIYFRKFELIALAFVIIVVFFIIYKERSKRK